MKRWGTVLAALLLAGGCAAQHEPDRDAWADELARHVDVVDPAALVRFQDLFMERCDTSDTQFKLMAAMDLDSGRSAEWVRVNVRHACPDRLGELDETLDLLGN